MFSDQVLGGSGFVVDVFGLDFGAVVEEEFGDFDVAREVERMFAVAAPGRYERRIGGDERAELIDPAEAGGLMDANRRAAADRVFGEGVIDAIEEAEAAGPPLAFGVD